MWAVQQQHRSGTFIKKTFQISVVRCICYGQCTSLSTTVPNKCMLQYGNGPANPLDHWVWVVMKEIVDFSLISLFCDLNYILVLCIILLMRIWKWIKWSNRLGTCDSIIDSHFCSVDGTDSRIQKPTPFNLKWCSHKSYGAGSKNEIDAKH